MSRFSNKEKEAVQRLIPYAKRKSFVADLLINGYNAETPVNVWQVMRYAAGEAGGTYKTDIAVFLDLMIRGVETHELIGVDKMDEIREWASKSEKKGTFEISPSVKAELDYIIELHKKHGAPNLQNNLQAMISYILDM